MHHPKVSPSFSSGIHAGLAGSLTCWAWHKSPTSRDGRLGTVGLLRRVGPSHSPNSRAWVLQTQASRCPPVVLLCSPSCASYTYSRATCLLAVPHTGPTYSSSHTAHWAAPSPLALHACPQLVCPHPATFHSALLPPGLGCLCLQIPSLAQAMRLREPLSP